VGDDRAAEAVTLAPALATAGLFALDAGVRPWRPLSTRFLSTAIYLALAYGTLAVAISGRAR
jgi:hypothetical protein